MGWLDTVRPGWTLHADAPLPKPVQACSGDGGPRLRLFTSKEGGSSAEHLHAGEPLRDTGGRWQWAEGGGQVTGPHFLHPESGGSCADWPIHSRPSSSSVIAHLSGLAEVRSGDLTNLVEWRLLFNGRSPGRHPAGLSRTARAQGQGLWRTGATLWP